jgi:hypothetical protein
MKNTPLRKALLALGAIVVSHAAFAQLQEEKNVTITMDLQPILQLKMEGPDQLDFTFDEINEYYAGIVKYGATVLKVSSTVTFDLWAAGLSQGQEGNFLWDNPVEYAATSGASVDAIPLTALELRQFPANPAVAATCGTVVALGSDYSDFFKPVTNAALSLMPGSNNSIYCPLPSAPYASPTSTNALISSEKYIAGGTGTGAGCGVNGGSYLLGGASLSSNFRYVMDYRILPNLPVTFPAGFIANAANSTADNITDADGASGLLADGSVYANPGVYTMYVKYILAQDQ